MAETVRRRQRHGDLEAHQQHRMPPPPLTPGRRRPVVDVSDLRRAAVEPRRRQVHQAPALSSGPSDYMLLHGDFVACKLQLAQSNEDREKIKRELLDTTTPEERELLDTTTPEESSITNASSLPQPTSPLKEELILNKEIKEELILTPWMLPSRASFDQWRQQASGSGYAYHYLAMHEPDMLSSKELSIARATLGKSCKPTGSCTWAEAVTHSLTPPISARKPAGWNHQFFIRVDLCGVFHTYPELGGPFWSLEEVELGRLDEELRDPKMVVDDSDLRRGATPQRDSMLLHRDFVACKLQRAQSREDREKLYSKELSIARATLGKSCIPTGSCTGAEETILTHSLTPPISARKPAGWNHQFFIRVDLWGVFHTYPELGGPFWSLEEAEKAILRRLDELRDPKMCTNDGLSSSEIAIRDALHWPDGTRKYSSRSNPDRDHVGLLVQALLDKYNEENNLLEDVAYQVEDVVSFQEVYEGDGGWYYHLNCTRKTKVAGDKLFIEILKRISGQLEEFELTCLHMVKPVDNGPCYGCTSNDVSMKHPIDAGKYKGGHDPSWPRGSGCDPPSGLPRGFDARMKAKEERIRYLFQDRDVAKSDAGRNIVVDGSDKSLHERRNKSDAGRNIVVDGSDKSLQGKRNKSDAGRNIVVDGSDKSLQGRTRTGTVAADGSGKSLQGWTRVSTGSTAGSGKSLQGRTKMATGSADGSDKSLQGRTGKYVVPARRR